MLFLEDFLRLVKAVYATGHTSLTQTSFKNGQPG